MHRAGDVVSFIISQSPIGILSSVNELIFVENLEQDHRFKEVVTRIQDGSMKFNKRVIDSMDEY